MHRFSGRGIHQWLRCVVLLSASCALPAFAGGVDSSPAAAGRTQVTAASADADRGRLLYDTHCIGCHTTQAHWRDKHVVKSWADLLYQVARMQSNMGQQWSENEILDVAAYLNEQFYKVPCSVPGCRGAEARLEQPRPVAARAH